jgi:predicted enzyme related to lactoylglutathione lyase
MPGTAKHPFAVLLLAVGLLSMGAAAQEASETGGQENPVVFWELASNDAEASVAFFQKVFAWDIRKTDESPIHYVPAGENDPKVDGGIFTLKKAKLPFLTIYILVEDIEAKAKLIEENGGHLVEGPHEIPGGAKICLFNEPSGVTFAMYQPPPKKESTGG